MSPNPDATTIADVSNPFQAFQDLMPFRVQDILLVSSLYDSFTLQEDGRLNELILGKRGVTADTALRLARRFKSTPQVWIGPASPSSGSFRLAPQPAALTTTAS